MIEAHFDRTLTAGVEEELLILDAETFQQVPEVETLVAAAGSLDLPGVLKTELHASVVELATTVGADADEAVERLVGLRRGAAEIATAHGLRLAGAGSHPLSRAEDQQIADQERYRAFLEYAGPSARRQGVSGLHVHVGMPSAEDCFRVLETILPWLPLVLAVSANSPYFGGVETGMMSTRAEVLGLLPRHGAPPPVRSYAEWEATVERVVSSGLATDYTSFWWDVRPHPRFGTLEIRAPDQPTSPARAAALVRLLWDLCAWALEAPPRPFDPGARTVYEQNRWAASRFGTSAQLIHPDRPDACTIPQLLSELPVDASRLEGAACEAERQLEVGHADGLAAVSVDLVERTVAFDL